MSEQRIEGIMRDFVNAVEQKDVEKALSLLAEDATTLGPRARSRARGS